MSLETFVHLMLAGITLGAIYMVMAMGMNLVFGVTKIFNYAQGSFYTWGGYVAWYLSAGKLGLNRWVALPIAIMGMFLFGMVFEKVIVSSLRRRPGWGFTVIIVTLGSALLLDNLTLIAFGPLSKTLPPLMEGSVSFGAFSVSRHNIILLMLAICILVALNLFMGRTRLGMALRAVAQDEVGARIVGVPVNTAYSVSFGIAAALAAIAAILLAPRTLIYPLVGWTMFLKTAGVMVLGGLGSFKGNIVAAFVLAIVELFVSYFVGGMWALPFFLVSLVVVLIFRPRGLFG